MTAAALVPMGEVTHCCGDHAAGRHRICCDPADCTPCCPECPTCPQVQMAEAVMPGLGKFLARENARQLASARDRGVSTAVGDALLQFELGRPGRMVITPPIGLVLNWFYDVHLATVKEPF
jgi:hypothetical protein